MGETKVCTKCGEELLATTQYFHRAKYGKYGLFATCKNCKREVFKDSQKKYRKEHKGHYKELKDNWNEINKEHIKEYTKNYYNNNKEIIKERNKEKRNEWDSRYYANNHEKIIAFKRKYKTTERGKLMARTNSQTRRALKRKLEFSFTSEQWQICLNYFNNTCCYCGKESKLTQDHFIPLSKNGEYTNNNIVPCCLSCNSSKSNKSFFNWYPMQSSYDKQRELKILSYLNYNKKTKTQQLALTY